MSNSLIKIFALNDHPGAQGLPGPWESPVYIPVERSVVARVYEIGELHLGVSDAGLLNAGALVVMASVVRVMEGENGT